MIKAAVEIFSDRGLEAASTREIAKLAQTNLVSISYYFGSKLGLYRAAAEFIVSDIAKRFWPLCERSREGLLNPNLTPDETLSMFIEFMVECAHVMMGADTASLWGHLNCHKQFEASEAIDIMNERFAPIFEAGNAFVSRLTRRPVDSVEVRLQFLGILSMIEFTRIGRASVLRVLGWGSIGTEESQIVEDVLRRNLHLLFAE